jgi:hypothetical protein
MKPRLKLFGLLAVLTLTLVAVAYAAIPGNYTVRQNFTVDKSTGAVLMDDGCYTTLGNGSLSTSGTGVLNLSGTASTSVPCCKLILSCTAAGCLVGSTSASTTLPLPANALLTLPVNNVNQVWVSGGTNTVGFVYMR